MATRFYLPAITYASITPSYSASWEETGNAIRRMMVPYKSNSTFTSVVVTHANAAVNDALCAQYISEPIRAVTIAGTVKGIIRVLESAATNDCRAQMVIKVVSNDGSTVRGTLIAEDGSAIASEFSTTLTNRKFPLAWAGSGTSVSSVAALDGDRIVVEIGARFHAATAAITASFNFGDTSATDCAENETTTTANTPWIEFSDNIEFVRTSSVDSVTDNIYEADVDTSVPSELTNYSCEPSEATQTVFYVMRGKDPDCPGTVYRTWTVADEPDNTGAYYSGSRCGLNPLTDIVVIKKVIV